MSRSMFQRHAVTITLIQLIVREDLSGEVVA